MTSAMWTETGKPVPYPTRESLHDVLAAKAFELRGHGPLYFPPDPSCYGCLGTGTIQWAGGHNGDDGRCWCTRHQTGECEPDCCSPECRMRAELRGDE